jgi:hypothetical protein
MMLNQDMFFTTYSGTPKPKKVLKIAAFFAVFPGLKTLITALLMPAIKVFRASIRGADYPAFALQVRSKK